MLILPIKRKKKKNLVVSHYFGHLPPDQGSNKALSYSTISRDLLSISCALLRGSPWEVLCRRHDWPHQASVCGRPQELWLESQSEVRWGLEPIPRKQEACTLRRESGRGQWLGGKEVNTDRQWEPGFHLWGGWQLD